MLSNKGEAKDTHEAQHADDAADKRILRGHVGDDFAVKVWNDQGHRDKDKGIRLNGSQFEIVKIGSDFTKDDILVHNPKDKNLAMLLCDLTYQPQFPKPIGVLYQEDKTTYEDLLINQIEHAKSRLPDTDFDKLIRSSHTWKI